MALEYLSVPFNTDEIYSGLAELTGIMNVTQEGVRLEFQVKDSIFGVLKGKPKSMHIPYPELNDIEFRSNLFTSKFRVYINSMELLSKFPKASDGYIVLKVKRRNKAKAKQIEAFVKRRLSETRMALTGNESPTPFFD